MTAEFTVSPTDLRAYEGVEELLATTQGASGMWIVASPADLPPDVELNLVPEEFRAGAFSEHTEDLMRYADAEGVDLGLLAPHGTDVVSFKKSALTDLGTFLATNVALPVLLSLVSSYLYDLLRKRKGHDRVQVRVLHVVWRDGERVTQLCYYDAPGGMFKEASEKLVGELEE